MPRTGGWDCSGGRGDEGKINSSWTLPVEIRLIDLLGSRSTEEDIILVSWFSQSSRREICVNK